MYFNYNLIKNIAKTVEKAFYVCYYIKSLNVKEAVCSDFWQTYK